MSSSPLRHCKSQRRTRPIAMAGTVWLSLVTMVALVAMCSVAGACPGVKWKGGKQTVECRNRGLITLPSNIDPQTQVLDLSGSNLQTLPREAFARANLLNLQKIYLASCRIGQIEPTAWRGLTNLIELDLSDNLLTAVPSGSLKEATSLRELKLSGNPIGKIEQGAFDQAPGLVKLDLSDCQIQVIAPGAFDGLDQLSHLRLSGNRLEELRPDVVASLPARLHGFELQANPWICDCRMRYLREWLHAHNVPIPASSACVLPPRLAGRGLVELQVDDFACPPQVIPPPAAPLLSGGAASHLHVEAAAGENATLTCRMSGVPSPEITWLWRGRPMTNGSSVGSAESSSSSSSSSDVAASASDEPPGRTVLIIEEGKYEKTSHLILSPARETDSGEFVCVAANAAGLARANLTLRVDVQAPVVGGLGGAQIAGLGAGLFILLAAVVAILLLMLIRTRGSSQNDARSNQPAGGVKDSKLNGGDGQQLGSMLQQQHQQQQPPMSGSGMSPVKSSSAALEYGQVAFVNPNSPDRVVVVTTAASATSPSGNKPDLIHDARSYVAYSYTGAGYATLAGGRSADRTADVLAVAASDVGDYHSAQTDSFYPSALWDHVLPHPSVLDESVAGVQQQQQQQQHQKRVTSPINLPHVPLVDRTMATTPFSYTGGQIIQNPRDLLPSYLDRERDSEAESAVSVESYSLPRRIPAAAAPPFVPYPADYGLPKSPQGFAGQQQQTTPERTTTVDQTQTSVQQQQLSSSSTGYGSKVNSSSESSPASSATKSPRFLSTGHRQQQQQQQQQTGSGSGGNKRTNHHFARDSPDEGYQEECATDV